MYYTLKNLACMALLSLSICVSVPVYASAKKLLLLPLKLYADESKSYLQTGVKSMLVSRLAGGNIEIIPDGKLTGLLDEEEKGGITAQPRAEELTRALGADYAVYGSITVIGAGYSLDLSLLKLDEAGSTVTRVSRAVNEDQFIPQLADVISQVRAAVEGKEYTTTRAETGDEIIPKPETGKDIFGKVEEKKGVGFKPTSKYQELRPTHTLSVDMAVMAFDTGDLDGDGTVELVVLGRNVLHIYKRQGASFVQIDSLNPSFGEEFLKVSVGDCDNNGTAEIYVVGVSGKRAHTTVLEWTGGFKRLSRETGHIRVVRDQAGAKPLLLFQNSTMTNFFSGRIFFMEYERAGNLSPSEKLPKLKGAQFYTLIRYDLNRDGSYEWLGLGDPGLDEQSALYVWDQQGEVLFEDDKQIGGTNNTFNVEATSGLEQPRVPFNSRLLISDIDGDGNREVTAIKNIPLLKYLRGLRIYTKGELIIYQIDGIRLSSALETRVIDYCLVDIQIEGSTLFLAAQKFKLTAFSKGSGLIMWFE